MAGTNHPAMRRYVPASEALNLPAVKRKKLTQIHSRFNSNFVDGEKEYFRIHSQSQLMKYSSLLKQFG